MRLKKSQLDLIKAPLSAKIFLQGPAGAGKTTVGARRTLGLLSAGVAGNRLLVLTPQRTLQEPYRTLLSGPETGPGGEVTLVTLGGLARRMCDLFWPIAAEVVGFAHPERPPVFLTIETAQYHMARLVRPLLEQGFFESVTIDRNRLYSQILDNLNKAASVGFDYREIGSRLDAAWYGDPAQRRVYVDAQECANRFRAYCLEHNLLDFSLQLETFWKLLWRIPECHDYLTTEYRHLIYDNVEEDVPVVHDLLCEWLPDFDSALLIYDTEGGYRRFLGADPESGLRLAEFCETQAELGDSFVTSPQIRNLEAAMVEKLLPEPEHQDTNYEWEQAMKISATKFFPQMLDVVAGEIHTLVSESRIPPAEIVILAPYLSDGLRFSLAARLNELHIPWRSHRPSRSLRDEPASQCLLTLAELAHPQWGIRPTKFDVAYAFMQAIGGMDLVRAQLLAEIVYRARDGALSSFEKIVSEVQERITFVFGKHYESLREWIDAYRLGPPEPLDHFLRRLFGEVLSQKGFGFHRNYDSARVAASLIESIQKFRWAMETAQTDITDLELGKEYILMLQDGVIAAQYLEAWHPEKEKAVLLAPAHTFLMMNQPATYQFWLDVGSSGWWERLSQPLTQPYVLSRGWDASSGQQWTDANEVEANQQTLARLVTGLLRRCRQGVYFAMSDLGEAGFEQRGPLLKAVWRMQMQAQQVEPRSLEDREGNP